MNNRRKSPLLYFLQHQLDYRGKKNVGIRSLQTIKTFIDNMLINCCLIPLPPFSNNFVTIVHTLLKEMLNKESIPKLKVIQTYVNHAINCCE